MNLDFKDKFNTKLIGRFSISQALALKHRIRILTIIAGLAVCAFMFQLIITRNPQTTKATPACAGLACTIDTSGTLTRDGATFSTFRWGTNSLVIPDGADLTINGMFTTVTMASPQNDPHQLNSLTINNARVTHGAVSRTDDLTETDNFSVSPINADKWSQATTGNGIQSIATSTLSHKLVTGGAATEMVTQNINPLVGDFNVIIDYNMASFDISSANTIDFGLVVTDATQSSFYSIKRQRKTGAGTYNRYRCVRTGSTDCGTNATTNTSGQLRLNRRAGTIYAYRRASSVDSWSEVDNWNAIFTTPATIKITTTNDTGFLPFEIRYDNFAATGMRQNPPASLQQKKVDLAIAGELAINGSGSINVNGKGYPSPDDMIDGDAGNSISPTGMERGFGLGGGENFAMGSFGIGSIGGGGGYGGHGAYGFLNTILGGATYGDQLITDFDFGSAGGYADADNSVHALGGSGGGRIKVTAGDINLASGASIAANGNLGSATGSGWSGRGSGGSIILRFNRVTGSTLISDVSGGLLDNNSGMGTTRIINYTYDSTLTTSNIFARGGFIDINEKGAGGGGRILLEGLLPDPVVGASRPMRKTLWPILQKNSASATQCNWTWGTDLLVLNPTSDGTNPNCTFNPYSLAEGDRVEVAIIVDNAPSNERFKVSDHILHSNNVYCDPIAGSANSNVAFSSSSQTVGGVRLYNFIIGSITDETILLRYRCEVKKL